MVSTADWDQGGRNCLVQADLSKQGSWSIIFNICLDKLDCDGSCTLAND